MGWGIRNVRELLGEEVTELPWGQAGEGGRLPGKGTWILSVGSGHFDGLQEQVNC